MTAVRSIKQRLAAHFQITHATVEIEYDACVDDHDHDDDDEAPCRSELRSRS
jgi:hypothetical protein